MLAAVIRVHPWARLFFERDFDRSAAELEQRIRELISSKDRQVELIKLIDQMRASA